MQRAEHELLLCCRYTGADVATEQRLHELLQQNLDWTYVFRMAGRHGIAPLLDRTLSALATSRLPAPGYDGFRRHVTASGMQSRLLVRWSGDVLRRFEKGGVRALAFKGGSLAKLAYGDVALRQFTDLDLLVHRGDYERARRLLLGYGYREHSVQSWETHFASDGSVSVDLHHGLSELRFPVSVDFEAWWRRRQLVDVDGQAVATLSSEDLLVVLAVQIAKDAWSRTLRLAKVYDITQMMTGVPGLDWTTVEHESTRMGVRGMLAFAAGLASTLFRVPVTERLAAMAPQTAAIALLVSEQVARMFEDSDATTATTRRRIVFHWRLRERWRDRLWPFVAIPLAIATPNDRDRAVIALPGLLAPLYYIVRPVRLAAKYGRRYVQRRLRR